MQQIVIKASFIKDDRKLIIFLIVIFQVSLFFLCTDLDGKSIIPYLLPKHFRLYF